MCGEEQGFAHLDEPQQAPGDGHQAGRRAELLLGVLLLLAVAGWSVWNWREQQQLAAYNSGKRYAASRNWAGALAAFRSAGDYADAGALAQQAAGYMAEQGRLYAAASEAAGHEDWLVALQDLRLLRTLQPDYRDSSALYSVVEDHTYTAALAGVVALRTAVTPAGLYLRNDQTWVWLPGSDSTSSLHGAGPGGCLLYDVPTGRSRLDGTAANPNLFATSVLSLDLAPETRALASVRVADGSASGAALAARTPGDQTGAGAGQTGALYCGADLARPASPARSWHRGGSLLAYIGAGDLRVRSINGRVDLLLEQGVQTLYDSTP